MQIGPSNPPVLVLPASVPKADLISLQVGQLLTVKILSQPRDGNVTLSLNGAKLPASTTLDVEPGQTLKVRVEKGSDQVLLRVLDQATLSREVRAESLRAALPKQSSMTPLLANLQHLSKPEGPQNQGISKDWVQLATRLLSSFTDLRRVTQADGLRQAMQNSGIFLEQRLARQPDTAANVAQQDLKAQLLRLSQLLSKNPANSSTHSSTAPTSDKSAAGSRPTAGGSAAQTPTLKPPSLPPPTRGRTNAAQGRVPASIAAIETGQQAIAEIRGQVEGANARVQLLQLSSLPQEDGARQQWQMEMPVQQGNHTDLWGLQVESSPRKGGQEHERLWSINLSFDIADMGPVYARITLVGETVSSVFWAEHPDTEAWFRGHLQDLRQQLADAGLQVGDLSTRQGRPPDPDPEPDRTVPRLLSMKA